MKYERIERATFLERPNRFIAYARIAGKQETIHVKNTGRCAELLVPEAEIFVQESDNPERKTKWDLIGVRKGDRLINMDSQIPNKVVEEWLRAGNLFLEPVAVRPETTYGNSRFDFYVESGETKAFIEVKGVTLEEDGVVRFPDAPSERAVKHMEELIRAKKEGYDAYVFLVIQMKGVRYFTPNMDTQPEFGEVLKKAIRNVELLFTVNDIGSLKKIIRFIAVTSSQIASTSATVSEDSAETPADVKDVRSTSAEHQMAEAAKVMLEEEKESAYSSIESTEESPEPMILGSDDSDDDDEWD